MLLPSQLARPFDSPYESLVALFVVWKSLLLFIAACSPGPGYDTSASLSQAYGNASASGIASVLLNHVSEKLTRWDAIYFSKIAARGYLHEQEWAFGWGWTSLVAFFSHDLRDTAVAHLSSLESLVGATIAHASHGLSVVVLYHLAQAVFPGPSGRQLGFIAGCLHIISPAGIFLSAPYGESTFALLSFIGFLLFVRSVPVSGPSSAVHDLFLVISGLVLGCAATVRGNGLLSGLLFLEEVFLVGLTLREGLSFQKIRRLASVGLGGVCIAFGFMLPQYIAYQEYCVSNPTSRPWCAKLVPSIFAFVQEHYWNVGFLRYWKLSNVPLFVLAAPVLAILFASGLRTMDLAPRQTTRATYKVDHYKITDQEDAVSRRTIRLLRSLAYPQLVLAAMAITHYHIQIISRIASGYPVWYFWLAYNLLESGKDMPAEASQKSKAGSRWSRIWQSQGGWERTTVMYMVMYGLIQAGLFASFLPPA